MHLAVGDNLGRHLWQHSPKESSAFTRGLPSGKPAESNRNDSSNLANTNATVAENKPKAF